MSKCSSGSRRPTATAGWNGAPLTNVKYCLTAVMCAMRSGVDMIQPIFQPVTEKVLPAEEMETSRSRAAEMEASGTCWSS